MWLHDAYLIAAAWPKKASSHIWHLLLLVLVLLVLLVPPLLLCNVSTARRNLREARPFPRCPGLGSLALEGPFIHRPQGVEKQRQAEISGFHEFQEPEQPRTGLGQDQKPQIL